MVCKWWDVSTCNTRVVELTEQITQRLKVSRTVQTLRQGHHGGISHWTLGEQDSDQQWMRELPTAPWTVLDSGAVGSWWQRLAGHWVGTLWRMSPRAGRDSMALEVSAHLYNLVLAEAPLHFPDV